MRPRIALVWFPPAPPSDLDRLEPVHSQLCSATDALMARLLPSLRMPPKVVAYNVGVAWLAAYAGDLDVDVAVLRPEELRPCEYDTIGFSVTCPDVPDALALVEKTTREHPDTLLLVGGPHFHAASSDELQRWIDAGVSVIDKGAGLGAIDFARLSPGLRVGQVPVVLDTPWMRLFEEVRGPDYATAGVEVASTIPNVCASTGCMSHCAFCAGAASPWTPRALEDVRAELEQLAAALPRGRMVHFTDCDLAQSPSRLARLLRGLPDGLVYSCDMHLRSVRSALVQAMWEAGFVRINVGIEDTQADRAALGMLSIRGSHREALSDLRAAFGGVIRGYFMVGLPGTANITTQSHLEELAHLLETGLLDIATVKTLVPYPGTQLGEHPEAFGVNLLDRNLKHYRRLGRPVYETAQMTSQDIDTWLLSSLKVINETYGARLATLDAHDVATTCNYFRTMTSREPSPISKAQAG
jgi:radical SAM superfamily enzyme YgiQ (UPF0313 family)